jgi:hypothetical protein
MPDLIFPSFGSGDVPWPLGALPVSPGLTWPLAVPLAGSIVLEDIPTAVPVQGEPGGWIFNLAANSAHVLTAGVF